MGLFIGCRGEWSEGADRDGPCQCSYCSGERLSSPQNHDWPDSQKVKDYRDRLEISRKKGREISKAILLSSIPFIAQYTGRSEKELRELFVGVVPDDLIPNDDD